MIFISKEWLDAGIEAAMILEEDWKGIKNLESLSTKLVPHHGSGTSAMAGNSNVGCYVVPPSKFMLLPDTIGLE